MAIVVLSAGLLVSVPATAGAQIGGIGQTKHNLSVTGPGPIKATSETQICVFCHTPHNANPLSPPLWNRELSTAAYIPYSSASLQSAPGQPNGYSKLCLSCHDGTIAIGSVRNLGGVRRTVAGLESPMPAGPTRIGTVLTNDHPISFVFDQALRSADQELADPSALIGPIRLYPGDDPTVRDSVQCTTCHDPHTIANPKFLKKSPMGQTDNLCLTCHQKPGWVGSTHESDTFFYPKNQTTTQVRDHSCFACHTPHTVEGAERLLRNAAVGGGSAIEETCYLCHKSSAAGGIVKDLQTEFAKAWAHPITLYGGHKPVFISTPPTGLPEGVLLRPGQPAPDPRFTDTKHVECVDCHNPHRVKKTNRTEGMRGIALDGSVVSNVVNDPDTPDGIQKQHQLCFRCHGDTFSTVIGPPGVPLASKAIPSNKRLEFQPANSALHPVAGKGRNISVNLGAQLTVNGLSTASIIKCTDCHTSNAAENTFGRASNYTGPDPLGPHGSIYPSIRRAPYWNDPLTGPNTWNADNFKLCFRCHDQTKLTSRRFNEGAASNFYDDIKGKDNLHWVHLIDRIDKSRAICKNCHYNIHSNVDPPNTQYRIDNVLFTAPPPNTHTHLVNFSPDVLPIGGRTKPEWWINTTTRERRCYLLCHGSTMDGFQYRPSQGDDDPVAPPQL